MAVRKWNRLWEASHLPTILFAPGEDTTLTVTVSQEQFDIFLVHAPRPSSVHQTISIGKVDSVLVQQLPPLLLVICSGGIIYRLAMRI